MDEEPDRISFRTFLLIMLALIIAGDIAMAVVKTHQCPVGPAPSTVSPDPSTSTG